MSKGRALGFSTAIVLAAAGLAGCGGSSKPVAKNAATITGGLDPANKVPASVVAYASIVIKPDGSLKTNLVQTIDKLAGPGSADHLASELTSSAGAQFKQITTWASGTIGIALTAVPSGKLTPQALYNNLLIVVPTSDPAAAKQYIAAHPTKVPGVTARVDGSYAVAGGAAALAQEGSVSPANSLASDASYRSATTQIGGNQLATVFVRPRPVIQALAPKLSSSMTSAQLTSILQKLPAGSTLALGATAGPNTLSFDAVTQGFPKSSSNSTSSPSDVGSLPGTSWLALAIGGALADPKTITTLENEAPGLISQAQSRAGSAGNSVQGFLPFVESDVIPALGPMSLSLAGTSLGSLRVGFELSSDSSSAETKLASALSKMLKGLPLDATNVSKHLVITFGYASAQDFLSPPSQLSGNPTYKAALAQMPAGSQVSLYLNFGPIAALGSVLDKNQSDSSVWKIASKLSYLIAGGTSTHMRVVLAVK